ncbi:hypothetical protein AGOR_G00196240 [Albula goreensis]|uniref:Uncharacterized protein n=1 Tax=Albula goreensis TaxID=1534307 RepID=A0A8T3CPZ9_9TELE|nr:hypothetical protein AGOR_G00196240 [Albula goreensis]
MKVRAHLVGQFGQAEESLEHFVHISVPFGRYLKVGALFVPSDQLLNFLPLHLSVELPVTLVSTDHQGDVNVLFSLVFQTGLGLIDLLFQTLDLPKRLFAVQTENQNENITCRGEAGTWLPRLFQKV